MFFILSKILDFINSPLVWIELLLLLSLILRKAEIKKRLFITGITLFLFFSNSFLLDEVMRQWEIAAIPNSAFETKDIGIVLGGLLRYDTKLDRIQFYRGNDRLLQAVELYRKGKIKKIFFVGGSGDILKPEEKEAIFAKRFLKEFAIPEEDILLESESRNTFQNAVFAKQILDTIQPKPTSLLLITSGIHMRRAKSCFVKAGMNVTSYSVDRYSGPRKFIPSQLLLPSAEALQEWELLFHELSGFITYKIAGYL